MAPTDRGMTPKQKEVFDLVQELGPDAKAIAARIGTTENNVHGHIRRLRQRGHLPERAATTNGGQRRPGRPPRASATPPAARVSNQRPGEVPVSLILGELTEHTESLLREAEVSRDEIMVRLKANQDQAEALQREREELSEAASHLEKRVEALRGAATA